MAISANALEECGIKVDGPVPCANFRSRCGDVVARAHSDAELRKYKRTHKNAKIEPLLEDVN